MDGGSAPSQGHCLHGHRINADIHAFSGIQTHDPSVRASEDSSCLRPRRHCDRRVKHLEALNTSRGTEIRLHKHTLYT
jgi:hypothetical protein